MKRIINVGGFHIDKLQRQLVNEVLKSERLSYGPMTEEFEKQWAKLHNVKYALFCNSGTSALQVALHALKQKYGWKDGDEVIIPATTFVATMNIVLHNNLKPVFVDVEGDYFNIDPDKIEEAITDRTRAIIPVHLLGQPAQMDKIMKLARKYHLRVLEDSCETVASTYAGRPVGSWGDVACFSTYASHLVVTGVGGFATTDNSDLAVRIKGLYNHGRDGIYNSIDDNKKGVQIMKSRFNFIHSGYSYRLTELESALGIGHLKRFKKELKQREKNAKYLIKNLRFLEEDMGMIQLPKIHPKATHSWMLFPIVLSKNIDKEQFKIYLEEHGVMTRDMMPLLNQPYVREMFGENIADKFPVSKHLLEHAFLIGIHQDLTKEDLDHIAKTIYWPFTQV